MQSIGRAAGSKALYLLSECARNSQEKNFPPMVSSHSESTKVNLTHPKEIQKSMEVKRRKEAKKQNDFCGGKRHIATFQNYRNQLVFGPTKESLVSTESFFHQLFGEMAADLARSTESERREVHLATNSKARPKVLRENNTL